MPDFPLPALCPRCGATLGEDAPHGLCPACLMLGAGDSGLGLAADLMAAKTDPGRDSPRAGMLETDPVVIGPYRIIEKMGEGGFGIVYRAEQTEPIRREVALKVIKPGMDSREIIRRFEAERRALAMMEHPHIAAVHDAGSTDNGRPYFVMELVRGQPITTYCDERQLTIRKRLELFIPVCQAVQHAHQKSVLHRDLKPSNILVMEVDGKAVPKVIDFGIAKALDTAPDESLHAGPTRTHRGAIIGTLQYMSPEQAGSVPDVDTRSDIYALGAVLYEILTGVTPLTREQMKTAAFDEILRFIREEDAARPSSRIRPATVESRHTTTTRQTETGRLVRILRGDIDWIVMKALEKDRARRYDTANAFAADIRRFLNDEPVLATPPTTAYRFRKFARRNKAALGVAALIAVVLVTATGISMWQAKLAKEAAAESEAVTTFLTGVFQSPDPARDGRTITVAETLDTAVANLDGYLSTQPALKAKLSTTLGTTYQVLGLARDAIPLLEKARDFYLAEAGPDDKRTLTAVHNLANAYNDTGRWNEALKLREETLRRYRTVFGPDDSGTRNAMNSVAVSYSIAGRRDDALKMREEALKLTRAANGPEDNATLLARHNLAASYFMTGRWVEAMAMREQTLALYRKASRPDRPGIIRAMISLAESYYETMREEESFKLLAQALALSREVHGLRHSETLRTMLRLAVSSSALGRRDDALKLREEVVEICVEKYGRENAATIAAMSSLANSYYGKERMEEAFNLWEESLANARKVLGTENSETVATMRSYALSLFSSGREDEGIKLLEEAVALGPKVDGPENPHTLSTMVNLAVCYRKTRRSGDAIRLLEEALPVMRRVLPPNHSNLSLAFQNLINLYGVAGREDDALRLLGEYEALRAEVEARRRAAFPAIRSTIVPADSEWKWLHPTDGKDPSENTPEFHTSFFLPDFADAAWKTARDSGNPAGGFGYGKKFSGVDIGTPENEEHSHTAYFRHSFKTNREYTDIELRCQRDDGIIIYLDGGEVFRDNMESGAEAYLLPARKAKGPDNDGMVHCFPIPGPLAPGPHTLAISVHNTAQPSSDLRLGGVTLVEVDRAAGAKEKK